MLVFQAISKILNFYSVLFFINSMESSFLPQGLAMTWAEERTEGGVLICEVLQFKLLH